MSLLMCLFHTSARIGTRCLIWAPFPVSTGTSAWGEVGSRKLLNPNHGNCDVVPLSSYHLSSSFHTLCIFAAAVSGNMPSYHKLCKTLPHTCLQTPKSTTCRESMYKDFGCIPKPPSSSGSKSWWNGFPNIVQWLLTSSNVANPVDTHSASGLKLFQVIGEYSILLQGQAGHGWSLPQWPGHSKWLIWKSMPPFKIRGTNTYPSIISSPFCFWNSVSFRETHCPMDCVSGQYP